MLRTNYIQMGREKERERCVLWHCLCTKYIYDIYVFLLFPNDSQTNDGPPLHLSAVKLLVSEWRRASK